MKVLLVADARSVHTRRWALSLNESGVETVLYSIFPSPDDFFSSAGIRLHVFDMFTYKSASGLKCIKGMVESHIKAVRDLRSVIDEEKPDILHAHYATSFGLIAALSGFHPFLISVWGSDVYRFPYQNFFNRMSVKYILKKADRIMSTSNVMARQTRQFTDREIEVIPFGVDIGLFRPLSPCRDEAFMVGNVKSLSPVYGIDVLINAFSIVRKANPGREVKLMIVGDGPCRSEYEELCGTLGVKDSVVFTGRVPNERLPEYYNRFSVAVSLSRSESFGVVAVEAMACGCPVVTSDAEGFTEVVADGETGFVVPRNDPGAAAEAIQKFIDDPFLREKMGRKGEERVRKMYDWKDSIGKMLKVYSDVGRS